MLIYLSLFIHQVLKRAEKIPTKAEALKQIMPLASGSHVMPGEPSWPLGTLLPAAKSASELGASRLAAVDLALVRSLAHPITGTCRDAARLFQATPGIPSHAPSRAHLQCRWERQQALAPVCKTQVSREGVCVKAVASFKGHQLRPPPFETSSLLSSSCHLQVARGGPCS